MNLLRWVVFDWVACRPRSAFRLRKWSAVALWAWDIVVDNCAICRNHIMDLCIECQVGSCELSLFADFHRFYFGGMPHND